MTTWHWILLVGAVCVRARACALACVFTASQAFAHVDVIILEHTRTVLHVSACLMFLTEALT